MKYRTYRKLREKAPTIRRAFFIAVAVIVAVTLFISALVLTTYNAAEATNDEETIEGGITVEIFRPLDCKLSEELQEYTYYLCQHNGVEFELVMAVMSAESAFDPEAVSGTGDYGLMQINEIALPELSDKLGITDITDPYQNIRGGVYLLGGYAAKYDEPARVLMAYNMGDYGSSALWEEGVHTTAYTDKVLTKYKEYKEATHGKR